MSAAVLFQTPSKTIIRLLKNVLYLLYIYLGYQFNGTCNATLEQIFSTDLATYIKKSMILVHLQYLKHLYKHFCTKLKLCLTIRWEFQFCTYKKRRRRSISFSLLLGESNNWVFMSISHDSWTKSSFVVFLLMVHITFAIVHDLMLLNQMRMNYLILF